MEELIETIAKFYEKPSTYNNVFLMKHLFNMNMTEGWSIIDHLNEFNTVTISYLLWVLILMKKVGLS